ncbi:MAG TPA: TonB family protein [Candidatus Limnocylindria bacterium]|nr:TonB family protein [Candidatus Limnocylindria bacterium]
MTESWKNWEGQVVDGQFQLREYLGGSPHSAVFLTEYGEGGSQKAAIKLIPADPDSADLQLSRWRQAVKLLHPHLLRIFQVGHCQIGDISLLYTVTECGQEDLSQILPQRPLTQAEARDMLGPVLDVLGYIHAAGFVHGRMKPANIMAVDEHLKISSDGLCRAGRSTASQSKPGVYDAPESSSGVASPAGDVWSLGMTLVESLTQRLPIWERIRDEEASLPESLPAPFLELARHCLRRDPARRWTVADIARWLNPATAVPQTQAEPRQPVAASPGFKKTFAKPGYLLPAVALGLLLIALLAGPKLFTHHMEAQPTPSTTPASAKVQPKSEPPPLEATLQPKQPLPVPVKAPPASAVTQAVQSAGMVKGEVLEQALPEVSEKARDSIVGTVRVGVRVQVDQAGHVTGATLDSPGPSKFFADKALAAAPRWKFFPPTVGGRDVASEWILRFDFSNSGTKVRPSQATP